MIRLFIILSFLCGALLLLYSAGAASDPTTATTQRAWPIQYRNDVQPPPMCEHIHIATIDLSDPRVHVRVCPGGPDPDGNGPWKTTLQTVREIATRDGLDVAVNGNYFGCRDVHVLAGRKIPYFIGNPAIAIGWAMTNGKQWGSVPSYGADGPSLLIDDTGHATIDHYARLPANARQVVTGSEWLLKDGQITGTAMDYAPRTAVGIDREARTMWLVVVDGRRDDYSRGMTAPQLGDYLAKLGANRAIMLDGGGSSTMVLRDEDGQVQLKSRPSDGHDLPISLSFERAVDDALGVSVDR